MTSGRAGDTAAQAAARQAQAELLEMLTFSPEDGRIWLHGKRMMMLDVSSFGALRDELVARLGPRGARSVLTRIGYASGVSDADLIRQRWPTEFRRHAYIGSHLHRLEGITQIEPVRVNWDPERGHFDAEYRWRHTIEDDVNIRSHGLGTEPACWMEAGYATGYVSRMCDQLILFREIECRSMGSQDCRVIAAPASAWDDIDEDLDHLGLPARSRRGRARPDPRAAVEVLTAPDDDLQRLRAVQTGDRPIVGEFGSGDRRASSARAGGADHRDGADPGRKRRRQGAVRPRAAPVEPARRRTVHRRQLWGHSRNADRGRAVRRRARRLHGRLAQPPRPFRARGGRYAVSRRDCDAEPGRAN